MKFKFSIGQLLKAAEVGIAVVNWIKTTKGGATNAEKHNAASEVLDDALDLAVLR